MNLSYAWLQAYLPGLKLNSAQAAEQLTMLGLEVDAILPVAHAFTKVVVGQIIAAAPHPDADRLQLCQVDIGDADPLPIVCGAANARNGLKVAVAQVGACLGEKQDFKIKKSKIRGQLSQGMLCSSEELGISESATGILELPADAPIGKDLRLYLNLDDEVLDIDLTPNRGDCASILGVARELAVSQQLRLPQPSTTPKPPSLQQQCAVNLVEPSLAPLFLTQVIQAPAFPHMLPVVWQQRLLRAGLRPVHPIVDVLNLVMLEYGTPLHAYDAKKLQGDLQVQSAVAGTKVTLLDGKSYTLQQQDLVVTDDARVLALAGIMGAEAVAVDHTTTEVVLEAAYFSASQIARSARAHSIHSDSAYRFERGVDYSMQQQALQRVVEMLQQLVPEMASGPIYEQISAEHLPQRQPVVLRQRQISRLLGFRITDKEVEHTLTGLGMQVQIEQRSANPENKTHQTGQVESWQVIPPSWRFDIQLEVDILEELMRVYGYQRLQSVALAWPQQIQQVNTRRSLQSQARCLLAQAGFHEVRSYAFVDSKLNQLFNPQHQPKMVANPLAKEQAAMRTSLWPGLLQAAQYNLNRQHKQVRLFELATCFVPTTDTAEIEQSLHLAGVIVGSRQPQQWSVAEEHVDFYDLKAHVEALLAIYLDAPVTDIAYSCFEAPGEGELPAALHPGQSARVMWQKQHLGYIGKIHPHCFDIYDLNPHFKDIYLFELYLDRLPLPPVVCYQPITSLPSMRRDLALLVPESLRVKTIIEFILNFAQVKLPQAKLQVLPFDQYQDSSLGHLQKSLAISLTFEPTSRTLIDEEINKFIQELVEELQGSLKAQLRGM